MTVPDERGHAFPSTRWSRILGAGGAPRDLDALARAYWRPIRAWLAARFRLRDDAADDLAQEAFAFLLATDLFARADPARGRFRALLKTALGRFAIERHRRDTAQKRGGGREAASLDDAAEVADPAARSPDEALDEEWRRELLASAARRLEEELSAGGRRTHWRLFHDRFLAGEFDAGEGTSAAAPVGAAPAGASHAELAARHGITTNDVSNWLDHAKRRYRAILRSLVLDTVRGDEELADELRWLFGPLAASGAERR